ncbi:hypothetical protein G6011_10784 [Alternaria panax]|uniref:Uncharacterized protein n=1 Tax=Alternaria panax TaxID=48097 RepID=A0AAD4ICE7_9PLEO|nr:hypothetical protein G6011_10784 [Alternaria panax]
MAPTELVRMRPHEDVTLVLLMGENLECRWAQTTEMSDFDPFIPFMHEEMVGSTPGLGDAYEMANNALEAFLDLDDWREQVMNRISDAECSDNEATDSDGDACSQPEMRQALRLSREEFYRKRPKEKDDSSSAKLPTLSASPPILAGYPSNQRIAVPADAGGSSNLFITAQEGPLNVVARSSQPTSQRGKLRAPFSSRDQSHGPGSDMPVNLTDDSSYSRSAGKRPVESEPFSQSSFFDRTLGDLNHSRKESVSDAIEGEISASKEFVQVLVGPDSEVSTLQKESIWNRPYFRDPRYGVNHFGHNDDGIWELQHPALTEIEPEDFVFVAEYLESEGFGHRCPQEGDEIEETFAQCVSAWITAEKLGMFDMMDHIVYKLERLPEPEMQTVLVFACQVYCSQDTALASQARLKDYLAMYVANNWWIYLDDDNLSSAFIQKLKTLPKLERDVYHRRLPALEERIIGNDGDDDIGMG